MKRIVLTILAMACAIAAAKPQMTLFEATFEDNTADRKALTRLAQDGSYFQTNVMRPGKAYWVQVDSPDGYTASPLGWSTIDSDDYEWDVLDTTDNDEDLEDLRPGDFDTEYEEYILDKNSRAFDDGIDYIFNDEGELIYIDIVHEPNDPIYNTAE